MSWLECLDLSEIINCVIKSLNHEIAHNVFVFVYVFVFVFVQSHDINQQIIITPYHQPRHSPRLPLSSIRTIELGGDSQVLAPPNQSMGKHTHDIFNRLEASMLS